MRCQNCSAEFDDDFAFCPYCGTRVANREPVGTTVHASTQSLAEPAFTAPPLISEAGQEPGGKTGQGQLVLVVDDDESIRDLVSIQLMMGGYEPVTAENGEKALVIAGRDRPTLILLDIALPGLHGHAVLDELRKSEDTRQIPVVIISAFRDRETIEKAEAKGIHAYIVKPFDGDRLMSVVDSCFKQAG